MNILSWLQSLLKAHSGPDARALPDAGEASREQRRARDEAARDAARIADARLPPHQGGLNY